MQIDKKFFNMEGTATGFGHLCQDFLNFFVLRPHFKPAENFGTFCKIRGAIKNDYLNFVPKSRCSLKKNLQ